MATTLSNSTVKRDKDSYLQVEGGSVKFEPTLEDIKFADYGDNPYDQRVIGYEVTITVVAGQETIDTLKLAIAGTQDVKDGNKVTGVTDAPLGASNRARVLNQCVFTHVSLVTIIHVTSTIQSSD